jgi:hypothetical protein
MFLFYVFNVWFFYLFVLFLYRTVELHLPALIGTANHPVMQKIRITGFFFENRLLGQFELEKSFYKRLF